MSLEQELNQLLGNSVCFGMDIGTSNSSVAYKEQGMNPKTPDYMGANRGGVPSLAWRDRAGNEWYCDQVMGKQGLLEDPAGVWVSGKMKLGQKTVTLNGYDYETRYLMTKIVQRVLEISRKALEEEMVDMTPEAWVAGVPVRFTAGERGELETILQQATGGKRIRLVPEPILAAVANDYYTKKQGRQPRKVLVLDVGGGTFDVVMLVPNEAPTADQPEPYIALHPDGLREAGDVLDEKAEEVILEALRKNPGGVRMDILENEDHYDRRNLRQIAKAAKERLSNVDACAVQVTGVDCGQTMVNITRAQYEEKIRPVLQRMVDLSSQVLAKCGMGNYPDVDILMVGGASYTPLLRTLLEEKFHWIPKEQILHRFPEKAVALGAAIYAETPSLVKPKVAYGYGVNTHIDDGKQEVLRVVIPSGAQLPMTVTAEFSTLDANQAAVKFSVYEVADTGSSTHLRLENGRVTTYSITHDFYSRVPRDTPVKLTTTLTEDGVLTMKVEDFQPQKRETEKVFTMTNTRSQ